jgi:[ribosomal protein S18]-alanine N-acetyltransferase
MIRPAVVDDVTAITDLEAELFGADAWSLQSVTDEVTEPSRCAVVACDGEGTVIGYAVAMQVGDVVDLHRIAVEPAHRRTSVGRVLLAEVKRASRQRGAERMLLEVSDANGVGLGFYASAGFVQIDRRRGYYRDGSDALVFECILGEAEPVGGGAQ